MILLHFYRKIQDYMNGRLFNVVTVRTVSIWTGPIPISRRSFTRALKLMTLMLVQLNCNLACRTTYQEWQT